MNLVIAQRELPLQDASSISDFRPISLIHSFAKLFTKVLARRLTPLMHNLVKHNQSAFIRSRLIHENFRAVQLTAKLLHRSKVPSVLLKLDIAKAFDTVNWCFLAIDHSSALWLHQEVAGLDFSYAFVGKHQNHSEWVAGEKNLSR